MGGIVVVFLLSCQDWVGTHWAFHTDFWTSFNQNKIAKVGKKKRDSDFGQKGKQLLCFVLNKMYSGQSNVAWPGYYCRQGDMFPFSIHLTILGSSSIPPQATPHSHLCDSCDATFLCLRKKNWVHKNIDLFAAWIHHSEKHGDLHLMKLWIKFL